METNKRRGSTFIKNKLKPFYKSPPPNNTPPKQQQQPYRNNVQYYYSQSKSSTTTTTTTTTTTAATASSSSAAVLPLPHNTVSRRQQVDHNSNFFGVVGDCRIDTKASTYISAVQERFKLDRVDSERVVIIDQAAS